MKRRSFVSGSTALAAAPFLTTSRSRGAKYGEFGDARKRVALIGTGWYGTVDLLRLVQVAPVDVVGLCDVDSRMLAGAADLVATRQLSKKKPPTVIHKWEFLLRKGGTKLSGKVVFELEEYPEDKTEEGIERHVAPAAREHMRDLLARIVDRGRPVADIEEGYRSTSACLLANMSQELGRSLGWDAKATKITGDDESNGRLARSYREGYRHPAKD